MNRGALEGLSVVELGRMVAAPYCGKLLADLGADVLKLEQPRVGDPARRQGPFPADVPHPERSALFLYLNTNKRSVTLAPNSEAGRQVFERLVAEADVLIEDCAPGERQSLGLDLAQLRERNPSLVITSITAFGETGPYRDYRSHHINLYHASGHTSFGYTDQQEDGRPPPKAGGYLGEYDAGLTAAVGTLAAVLGRGQDGQGQRVGVSKLEALMCMERVDIGRLTNDPNPQPWRGGIGGMMKAKDGYCMITASQDHQWQGIVRAMGNPEWAQSERFKDEASRLEHRDAMRENLDAWAAVHTRDEIYHLLQSEGTPAGPVRNVAEVLESQQSRSRDYFARVEHPVAGAQQYPTLPYLFSLFSDVTTRTSPAPLLGEHNDEIYCGQLGHTREELSQLADTGVI